MTRTVGIAYVAHVVEQCVRARKIVRPHHLRTHTRAVASWLLTAGGVMPSRVAEVLGITHAAAYYAQVEAVRELVGGLVEALPTLKYITAHEDVTHDDVLGKTGGKTDVGPLWPWSVIDDCGLARVRYDFAAHEWEVMR